MRVKKAKATYPLVSVIVPTLNSEDFLEKCLQSIKNQTFKNTELIVIDNYSTDKTKDIATRYTTKFFTKGPERTAQRNYGAAKANGKYLIFIDSDMELGPKVIEQCVVAVTKDKKVQGVIIHEESFGENFWAKCKALERSFYVNVPWIEAARFFPAKTFHKIDGYNEKMVSGEDWDLSKRAKSHGKLVTTDEFIRHNEGHISFSKTLKKKYYYAQHAAAYLSVNPEHSMLSAQVGPLNRYKLFLSKPKKLFRHPILGLSMLLMKTGEFTSGTLGLLISRLRKIQVI